MLTRSLRQLLFAVLAMVMAGGGVQAQVQSRLEGHVRDSSGALVQGARVAARNVGTGVDFGTTTNDAGAYVFNSLPPAAYELRCEAAGFKATVLSGLAMETGLTKTVDIQLDLGALSETVQVKALAPLLDTGTATGQFIERATVQNMPLDSRRIGSLARLSGAVAFTSESGAGATPDFSMAGGRSENQMWMTDGATTQNNALGSPQTNANPPAESVQEIKMETNNYAAEFGRAGGGLILLTTRSGTNALHGAVYEFFRNDKLNARTFFSPGNAPLRYNTFGGSVGGHIIKNKTFFFANIEADRRHTGTTVSYTVPNPAELLGDFSRRRDVSIKDPVTGNPFPNNIIPTSRLDPIGLAYAKFYPAPTQPTDPTRAPTVNFVRNVTDVLNRNFLVARVDHTISQNDRAFVRVMSDNRPNTSAPVFPDPIVDPRAQVSTNTGLYVMGDWIHSFTPTVFHEIRYLFAERNAKGAFSGVDSGLNAKLGLKGVEPTFSATISATGLTTVGSNNQRNTTSPNRTNQLIDSLTWIKGNHQIKTGMEYRKTLLGATNDMYAGGNFTFSDRATGSGLATMLLGWTSTAQLVKNDLINARSDYWGAYVQDAWKLSSHLTLSLGLRWEMDTPRWDTNNRQSGFNATKINPVSGTPGIVTFAGMDGVSKYAQNFDTNNLAPKVALAWRPTDTIVIRSGYGIYYYGEYADSVATLVNAGFGLNGSFSSPDGGFTPAFLFKDGMPTPSREALTPAYGAVPVGGSPRFSPDFFEQNHPSAYSQQWNFTIQKELRGNMLAEIAYLGNVSHKLGGQNENINQIPLVDGKGPARQDQRLRPFPQFNSVVSDFPSWGNSSYHGMVLKLEKRYSSGLNFMMNYTWSKFLDDVKATAEVGAQSGNGYTHIERRRFDKSYSGSDIAHNFIASSVYDIPVGRGRRYRMPNGVLDQMFGGWGIGALAAIRSGAPYGVIEQTNATNTFSDSVRPNLLRSPEISGSRSRDDMLKKYLDTSAFAIPAVGEFGNAAREVGFGPGLVQIDVSVHKAFPMTERFKLVFRAEFINLPNRPNFANPNVQQGNPNFGRIVNTLSGTTGRAVEFSLRLEW